MKARTTASGILAALTLALTPATAPAQEENSVVPPENSAATQYTEAVPTAGGDKPTGGHRKPAPAEVLGEKNAHKLQSQGKDGREVAQIVAETAPETSPAEPTPQPEGSSTRPAGPQTGGSGAATGGDGGGGGDGQPAGKAGGQRPAEPPPAQPSTTELPDGSSGLGEVIGEATGSSSSGGLGLLLPLAIVAAIAWALAHLWQQRRPAE